MAEIAVHHGVANPADYAARMLRKAHSVRQRMVVLAGAQAQAISAALWAFGDGSFIAHAGPQASEAARAQSNLVLLGVGASLDANLIDSSTIVVNLCADVPQGFEAAAKLIDVVGAADELKAAGRARWAHYKSLGQAVQAVDQGR
jgi:DNA polymerase III subunit chi